MSLYYSYFFCFFLLFPLFKIFQLKLKVQLIFSSLYLSSRIVQYPEFFANIRLLQTFYEHTDQCVYNFRWEETFYWTTWGRCFCLMHLRLLWTGPVWQTFCRPRPSVSTRSHDVTDSTEEEQLFDARPWCHASHSRHEEAQLMLTCGEKRCFCQVSVVVYATVLHLIFMIH